DVVAVTESLVARAQGNYVSVDDIAKEIREKYPNDIGIVFPILSRNRFSMILKSIARSGRKIYLQLKYPRDEVGNTLMDPKKLRKTNIDPYTDILTEEDYYKYFGNYKHPFTGINYVDYYKEIVGDECELEIIFSNKAESILDYTKDILAADIHTRSVTKERVKKAGANIIYGLDDICSEKVNNRGYNPDYGLLGSNKASDKKLKLFPRDGQSFVDKVQKKLKALSTKDIDIEVMIYGDGAFKDPVGKIWELADPVVSPAYTSGLEGTPNEVKIKYLADNDLDNLQGEELTAAMKEEIKKKEADLVGNIKAQGTTPRQLTDLLGSLSDLVSGSGDKGTPIILIQGYFDNFATE
ncbi:MAG: coenzyme F420-0:L-glutamate ligase, partial [Bacillota bacterium]